MAALITSPRDIMQNTFFLPFLFFFKKKNNKTPNHEMHECYAMQILKQKTKKKKNKNKK